MHGNIPDAVDHALRSPRSLAPLEQTLGIGLIGAFTTIAAPSTENLALLQQGRYGMFALYLGITVFATFGAAYAGKRLADAMGLRYSEHHQVAASCDLPQNGGDA